MAYEVRITPAAERDIRKLPARIRGLVLEALDGLADDPRPERSRKLRGLPQGSDLYRIVVAREYRVVYQIRDKAAWVLVLRARDRKEVYRRVDDLKRLLQS